MLTDQQHPITPPPELQQQWSNDWHRAKVKHVGCAEYIATQAARWGADEELEACLDQLRRWGIQGVENLRNTRRPKPPSLAEQALTQLDSLHADLKAHGLGTNTDTIRRALEQLDG